MIVNPICVAIDTPDLARALQLANALTGQVGYLKLGMEFFYALGHSGYAALARSGIPIFLDLKLHDIPNTVAGGLKSLLQLEPRPAIVNVHASGGRDMMKAAREAVGHKVKLIGVTILTSLSTQDCWESGFDRSADAGKHAVALAKLAEAAGLDGVVCSPGDLAGIRKHCGADFLTVVPGIRPPGAELQDQKRIATPRAARAAGADILVIGRPITGAADPQRVAKEILLDLEG